MFGNLMYCWYNHSKRNNHKVFKFAAMVGLGRFVYNFGILINLIEHTPYKATFFVPCFIVALSIIENTKWLLSHLRR